MKDENFTTIIPPRTLIRTHGILNPNLRVIKFSIKTMYFVIEISILFLCGLIIYVKTQNPLLVLTVCFFLGNVLSLFLATLSTGLSMMDYISNYLKWNKKKNIFIIDKFYGLSLRREVEDE